MIELRWAIPASTTAERPRLQFRQCPDEIQFGAGSGWSEWQDVPYVVVQPEAPPRKITSVAEFCAEGQRLGLTAFDLAAALKDRPEFADCKPAGGAAATTPHEPCGKCRKPWICEERGCMEKAMSEPAPRAGGPDVR